MFDINSPNNLINRIQDYYSNVNLMEVFDRILESNESELKNWLID